MTIAAFGIMFSMNSISASAAGKATVTASSGKIRESADTNSDVLGSVKKNDKLDVIASTTASDGYTWYKVYVDGESTGYIRADLLSAVSGSITTESSSSSSNDDKKDDDKKSEESSDEQKSDDKKEESGQTVTVGSGNKKQESSDAQATETQFVQITDSTATAGKVIGSSVNVRENPSTNAKKVDAAKGDTEVSILGEAVDNDGKVWYQVNYGDVTGFIRNDFIEITETAVEEEEPVEEEVIEEEPVEEQPVNDDYAVVYEENAEGAFEWFLYDNVKGTKQSLEKLLAVVAQNQADEESATSQLSTYKIILVVLAAVVLALIIAVTVLIFKLRDAYEYEYDDDDEDDEDDDEDEDDEDDDEDDEDDEDERPRRGGLFKKSASSRKTSRRSRYDDEDDEDEDEDDEDERPRRSTKTSSKSDSAWSSRSFLEVDDDMEFEFLDIK